MLARIARDPRSLQPAPQITNPIAGSYPGVLPLREPPSVDPSNSVGNGGRSYFLHRLHRGDHRNQRARRNQHTACPSANEIPNGVDGFGPDKRFGAGIMFGEIGIDGGLQVGDRVEDAAADALPGHRRKQVLDGVEPGGRGRGEMEGRARMTRQPGQHSGMFMGSIVVSTAWITLPAGTSRSTALRKRMNSLWRWRCQTRSLPRTICLIQMH